MDVRPFLLHGNWLNCCAKIERLLFSDALILATLSPRNAIIDEKFHHIFNPINEIYKFTNPVKNQTIRQYFVVRMNENIFELYHFHFDNHWNIDCVNRFHSIALKIVGVFLENPINIQLNWLS